MRDAFDLEHLQHWVGREDFAEDVITPTLAARFHATFALPSVPAGLGEVAPSLIHFCLCQPAVSIAALDEDGHPARGDFLPPVPLPRRMWAGSTIEFHHALRVGDTVAKRSRIGEVVAKSGRSGTLCFVSIDQEIRSRGTLCISERQTLVYRERTTSVAIAIGEPAPRGTIVETIDVSAPLLFRYSALTFNAHRIHYDLPYAQDEEHYSGLVVHGPLQATLLMQLAVRHSNGRPPRRFLFQGVQPAIADLQLSLHAATFFDGGMALWTTQCGGPVTMHATAHWR